jgi:hypothetical protein
VAFREKIYGSEQKLRAYASSNATRIQINLSWTASATVVTFTVFLRTTSGGANTEAASNVRGTTYSVTEFNPSTPYATVKVISSGAHRLRRSRQPRQRKQPMKRTLQATCPQTLPPRVRSGRSGQSEVS